MEIRNLSRLSIGHFVGTPEEYERAFGQGHQTQSDSRPSASDLVDNLMRFWRQIRSKGQLELVAEILLAGGAIGTHQLAAKMNLKKAEGLKGYLSSVTKNVQRIFRNPEYKLIEPCVMAPGKPGYRISEPALGVLKKLAESERSRTHFVFAELRKLVVADGMHDIFSDGPLTAWFELWFAPRKWQTQLHDAEARETAGYAMIFWFVRDPKQDGLALYLGIPPEVNKRTAVKLFDAARATGMPATSPGWWIESNVANRDWTHIWAREFASGTELIELDENTLGSLIATRWKEFFETDLNAFTLMVDKLE